MIAILKGLYKAPRSQLSRKIVLCIFLCVIAIETIIFIPSYNSRREELLSHLRQVTAAKFTTVFHLTAKGVDIEGLLDRFIMLEGLALPNHKPIPLLSGSVFDNAMSDSFQRDALEAVRLTNNYIAKNHGELGMFATLFFGVLNPASGVLTYINSGHEPLYILGSAGAKKRLGPNGPAVGVISDAKFTAVEIHLEPGDILGAYTDGLTEALSAEGKLFTKNRLECLFEQYISSSSDLLNQIKASLFSHTENAEQEDDITLLTVKRIPLDNG
ncbi:MAG: serine/threonine-protein phosphatase [Deltaproteobacteria bacterium]|nr:serine/threonine-protein phosphatase [Deltaproteobacteria bacterium]MBW1961279.1 serine/threonine-protein phosphatase [Deltaproteobacteria bacterium]MBW2152721.1 serine/threonine-protein phosphatase [Deltaproteobacteria bacterium]